MRVLRASAKLGLPVLPDRISIAVFRLALTVDNGAGPPRLLTVSRGMQSDSDGAVDAQEIAQAFTELGAELMREASK